MVDDDGYGFVTVGVADGVKLMTGSGASGVFV